MHQKGYGVGGKGFSADRQWTDGSTVSFYYGQARRFRAGAVSGDGYMKKVVPVSLILLLAAVLLWLVLYWQPDKNMSIGIVQTPMGGDFTLKAATGPVDLKAMRGKVVVLFFGYTMCPDVCPTSMALLTSALSGLSEDKAKQVQGLFISVDPDRDTLQRLQSYGAYFHPQILGVTGTREQVAAVAKMYGAAYRKSEQASGTDYVMDHTADLYVVDQKGKLHSSVRHGTPPSDLLQLLRQLLKREI